MARRVFTRNLGVDPSPELGWLLTEVLRHDPAFVGASSQLLYQVA